MYFDNLHDLWTMAGHGPYVWAAYTITAVTLAALLWVPISAKKRQFRSLRAFYRRSDKAPAMAEGE